MISHLRNLKISNVRRPGLLSTALAAGLCLLGVAEAEAQKPVRMAMEAFGTEAQIEVRDLALGEAEAAIQAALTEIHRIQLLLDPTQTLAGGLGRVQQNAGSPVPVTPIIDEYLTRAYQYCIWSATSFSPLGGQLEQLWHLQDEAGQPIQPVDLRDAAAAADCEGVQRRPRPNPQAMIPPGGQFSTLGMARGFAVDQAIGILQQRGVTNAFVEIGHVVRGMGGGPDGHGWLVAVPGREQTRNPLDQFWLVDQSLSVVQKSTERRIDHRKGVPGRGVLQVAAVSELAVDTEVLTHTLFVVGMSKGQRLLGYLNPRPSVFWLLGNGMGAPLESQYHWSDLKRVQR